MKIHGRYFRLLLKCYYPPQHSETLTVHVQSYTLNIQLVSDALQLEMAQTGIREDNDRLQMDVQQTQNQVNSENLIFCMSRFTYQLVPLCSNCYKPIQFNCVLESMESFMCKDSNGNL